MFVIGMLVVRSIDINAKIINKCTPCIVSIKCFWKSLYNLRNGTACNDTHLCQISVAVDHKLTFIVEFEYILARLGNV